MYISRCISKGMYLEKPKQIVIWDGGSTYQVIAFLKAQAMEETDRY
jgi:hypothetical protein